MSLKLLRTVRFADPKPALTPIVMPLPERLIVPLKQHAGEPAEAVVKKGQAVAAGELLGRAAPGDPDSAPVHAPVAGKVADIVQRPDFFGLNQPCLVLEVAGDMPAVPQELPEPDHHLNPVEALGRIRDAGVVLSGNEPLPLAPQIIPFPIEDFLAKKADLRSTVIYHLLVAAVDSEPGVHTQRFLASRQHPALGVGLSTIHALANPVKSVVIVEPGLEAGKLESLLRYGLRTSAQADPAAYPESLDFSLIHRLTGNVIRFPQERPRDVGVALVRLETAFWAGLAVAAGVPQTGKWLTVVGPNGQGQIVFAALGTPVGHILDKLNIVPQEGGKVVVGGPISGLTIHDLSSPVTKALDAVFVIAPDKVERFSPQACINCGLCVGVCPTRLIPGELSKYCEYKRFDDAAARQLDLCLECGACAFVCPARRPMVHYFRYAKEELKARHNNTKGAVQ